MKIAKKIYVEVVPYKGIESAPICISESTEPSSLLAALLIMSSQPQVSRQAWEQRSDAEKNLLVFLQTHCVYAPSAVSMASIFIRLTDQETSKGIQKRLSWQVITESLKELLGFPDLNCQAIFDVISSLEWMSRKVSDVKNISIYDLEALINRFFSLGGDADVAVRMQHIVCFTEKVSQLVKNVRKCSFQCPSANMFPRVIEWSQFLNAFLESGSGGVGYNDGSRMLRCTQSFFSSGGKQSRNYRRIEEQVKEIVSLVIRDEPEAGKFYNWISSLKISLMAYINNYGDDQETGWIFSLFQEHFDRLDAIRVSQNVRSTAWGSVFIEILTVYLNRHWGRSCASAVEVMLQLLHVSNKNISGLSAGSTASVPELNNHIRAFSKVALILSGQSRQIAKGRSVDVKYFIEPLYHAFHEYGYVGEEGEVVREAVAADHAASAQIPLSQETVFSYIEMINLLIQRSCVTGRVSTPCIEALIVFVVSQVEKNLEEMSVNLSNALFQLIDTLFEKSMYDVPLSLSSFISLLFVTKANNYFITFGARQESLKVMLSVCTAFLKIRGSSVDQDGAELDFSLDYQHLETLNKELLSLYLMAAKTDSSSKSPEKPRVSNVITVTDQKISQPPGHQEAQQHQQQQEVHHPQQLASKRPLEEKGVRPHLQKKRLSSQEGGSRLQHPAGSRIGGGERHDRSTDRQPLREKERDQSLRGRRLDEGSQSPELRRSWHRSRGRSSDVLYSHDRRSRSPAGNRLYDERNRGHSLQEQHRQDWRRSSDGLGRHGGSLSVDRREVAYQEDRRRLDFPDREHLSQRGRRPQPQYRAHSQDREGSPVLHGGRDSRAPVRGRLDEGSRSSELGSDRQDRHRSFVESRRGERDLFFLDRRRDQRQEESRRSLSPRDRGRMR